MMKWIERFETGINWAVLLTMAVVVLMLAAGFAINLWRDIIALSSGTISNEQVYGIFGDLLLVLIGLELMHTVKVYLQDHTVHVEVILAVTLVAVARKVIAVNIRDQAGSVGLALLIIALAGSHWLLRRPAPPARPATAITPKG
jgi:uncharacterized membrane protein (DUF373 family)